MYEDCCYFCSFSFCCGEIVYGNFACTCWHVIVLCQSFIVKIVDVCFSLSDHLILRNLCTNCKLMAKISFAACVGFYWILTMGISATVSYLSHLMDRNSQTNKIYFVFSDLICMAMLACESRCFDYSLCTMDWQFIRKHCQVLSCLMTSWRSLMMDYWPYRIEWLFMKISSTILNCNVDFHASWMSLRAVSYTHLTLPTKRIV